MLATWDAPAVSCPDGAPYGCSCLNLFGFQRSFSRKEWTQQRVPPFLLLTSDVSRSSVTATSAPSEPPRVSTKVNPITAATAVHH